MKKQYRVGFLLGRDGSIEPPSLDEFAGQCFEWVLGRPGLEPPSTFDPGAGAVDLAETGLGAGATLRTIRADAGGRALWGMRFDHPDRKRTDLHWSTRVCLSLDPQARVAEFSCSNSLGRTDARLTGPVNGYVSRPRIVPMVLSRWGGRAGYPLGTEPSELSLDDGERLLAVLTSAERARPLILVSRSTTAGEGQVEVARLASQLAGLAHVARVDPSFDVSRVLPRQLSCWGGAARLYWPGFSTLDAPHEHPYWSPIEIERIGARTPGGLIAHLLAHLGELGAQSPRGTASWRTLENAKLSDAARTTRDAWQVLEHKRTEDRDAHLREQREWERLAGSLTEEKAELCEQVAELEAEVERLQLALSRAEELSTAWKQAWWERHPARAGEGRNRKRSSVPVESLMDAYDLAKEWLSDRLLFVLKKRSLDYLRDDVFLEKQILFNALEFLATTYFEQRANPGTPRVDLEQASVRACTMRYRDKESKQTMRAYPADFEFQHGGRTYWMEEHLVKGTSRDPQHSMRIGFAWSDQDKRVLVGFIGQHQDIGRH